MWLYRPSWNYAPDTAASGLDLRSLSRVRGTGNHSCQPFSCAGKQLAEKDPRHLWPHVARIIREASRCAMLSLPTLAKSA
jgi:hypothetical protein